MADISINWNTKVITVPKAYTTLVLAGPPQEIRQLDTDQFRKDLKAIEASPEGMPFEDTHRHNTTVTVGGVILARVIEIINGYTVTFEDGQYAVNLVGSNNNIADVTNVNQVSVRSTNSAGLQDLSSLQAASYQGAITIDVDNGVAGTLFPTGTAGRPVNNLTDALTISNERGIKRFELASNLTLDQPVDELVFSGASSYFAATVDLNGQPVSNVRFYSAVITGSAAAGNMIQTEQCLFRSVSLGDSAVLVGIHSAIEDFIVLGDNASIFLADSYSFVPGNSTPYIDFGLNSTLQLRSWSGGIELRNYDPTDIGSIDLVSGQVVLAASCTGGALTLRGVGRYRDFSGGAVSVTREGFIQGPISLKRTTEAPEIWRQE